jgi:hypothetical protein
MSETEVLEQQTEVAPPEAEIVDEVDEPAEGFEAPEGGDEDSPVQEEQLSDIGALVDRLSAVETSTQDLDYVKHRVNSELSRLEGIQSRVDRLTQGAEGVVTSDRIEQLEGTLSELTNLIMSSEMVDDATKISLREQQWERRLAAVESGPAPVPGLAPEPNVTDEVVKQTWDDATNYVAERAREMGFDNPTQIPVEVWQAGAGLGSPVRAADHVLAWVRAQTEGLEKVEQTAAKKRAAGNGTPTRSGTNTSIDDLVRSFGEGKDITDAEKLRVMEHLGIRA